MHAAALTMAFVAGFSAGPSEPRSSSAPCVLFASSIAPDEKDEKKVVPKDSRAAEFTRERYLKVKVTGDFKNATLRDILKEFAGQVRMDPEFNHQVMWTYADAALGAKTITYMCRDKELDKALDEVCDRLKIGYFVISQDDHPRDGWVRITAGAERGFGSLSDKPPAKTENDDETKAANRLAVAKEQIEKGRTATGKAVLSGIVEKFPKTKAATEAKTLLEKLEK
jgi:hypothetical protein